MTSSTKFPCFLYNLNSSELSCLLQFVHNFLYLFLNIILKALFSGEVHVYNLSDSELVTPIATGFTGGSGVTCLKWRKCDSQGQDLVASTQGGHILFWTVNVTKESMTLNAG